jgi:hypothetical protein
MRVTYDGGKSTPCYIEITANPDKRRRTAEIETTIYWDDGERPRRATCTREINRQREADRLFSEVLALLARAGIYPTPAESDEIHELLARICMVVKAA